MTSVILGRAASTTTARHLSLPPLLIITQRKCHYKQSTIWCVCMALSDEGIVQKLIRSADKVCKHNNSKMAANLGGQSLCIRGRYRTQACFPARCDCHDTRSTLLPWPTPKGCYRCPGRLWVTPVLYRTRLNTVSVFDYLDIGTSIKGYAASYVRARCGTLAHWSIPSDLKRRCGVLY